MRQSSAAGLRQSHIPHSVSNAALAAKLQEKKKEFEAVAALERASTQLVKRMDEIGDDFDVMADAGILHGQVLEQWPNMFRILSLFLSARSRQHEDDTGDVPSTTGQRLVRVPIEELRTREDKI